jgi:hypothetical protein
MSRKGILTDEKEVVEKRGRGNRIQNEKLLYVAQT